MNASLTREELSAFRQMAAAFAKRRLAPMLAHDSPDGDLSQIPYLLAEAYETGLLASPDPSAPGHETGIWGRNSLLDGPRPSLALLEEISRTCAGAALILHGAGLACHILLRAEKQPDLSCCRPAAALGENGFLPGPKVLRDPGQNAPARIETLARPKGEKWIIAGRKDFVFQSPDTDSYIIFARVKNQWALFLLPGETPGLRKEEAGFRMGLRACPVMHLILEEVEVAPENRLSFAGAEAEVVMEYLRLWCLGLVAIGAGTAAGAAASAWEYARQRWQGCTEIINHPGMGALLAEAESGIMVCRGLLEEAMKDDHPPEKALAAAATARLAGLSAAASAVTNCLQIFGGYGYMEDYRMEKRYRDIHALKSAGGSARELRMLIAGLSQEN